MRGSAVRALRVTFVAGAVAILLAGSAIAQAPQQQAAQPQPDFTTVQMKTTKLAGNVYTIEGIGPSFYPSPGGRPIGTTGMLAGPDGVLLVDSQFAPLTDKIVAAVKQVSGGPIRFLINTHLHGDHTGGNENFGKMGVAILARDELRARLAKGGRGGAPPAASLPLLTYRAAQTVYMNGEEVQLIPVMQAHTDGDTIVRFVSADVIMTGDVFRSDNSYPNIDMNNGGSLNGFIEALNTIANLAGPNTKIVPGHGAVTNKTGVIAHRDMMVVLRDRVAALIKEGKTQAQILAAKPTADFDARGSQPLQNADRIVTQVFTELSRAK